MRFKLYLEDEYGARIDMTSRASVGYMTSEIDGLYPPTGTISTGSYAGTDGSYLNNAYIDKRNIVIKFEMRGRDIEKRRHELYDVVKTGRYIKVYYYTNRTHVYSEGYIETCEVKNFTDKTNGQISILCTDPFWYDLENTEETKSGLDVDAVFHFVNPNETANASGEFPIGTYNEDGVIRILIYNPGEITGCTISFTDLNIKGVPTGSAISTLIKLVITNETNGQVFTLGSDSGNVVFLKVEETITISTIIGQRNITFTSDSSYDFSLIQQDSDWITLEHGWNTIRIEGFQSEDSLKQDISVTVSFTPKYIGV